MTDLFSERPTHYYSESQYLTIYLAGVSKSGKTGLYNVLSKSSGVVLGSIQWYGPWRQYCFFPAAETIWNHACMLIVKDVMMTLNALHKEGRDV